MMFETFLQTYMCIVYRVQNIYFEGLLQAISKILFLHSEVPNVSYLGRFSYEFFYKDFWEKFSYWHISLIVQCVETRGQMHFLISFLAENHPAEHHSNLIVTHLKIFVWVHTNSIGFLPFGNTSLASNKKCIKKWPN